MGQKRLIELYVAECILSFSPAMYLSGKFMRNALRLSLFIGLWLCLVLFQRVSGQESGTIVDVVTNDGRLNTLAGAIGSAELTAMYSSSGPFTLFAPTDAAFAVLTNDNLTNPNAIRTTLLYHTIQSAKNSGNLSVESTMTNAAGSDLQIAYVNGQFKVNNLATVVVHDIVATNGIIHLIDVVLDPYAVAAPPPADPQPEQAAGTDGTVAQAPVADPTTPPTPTPEPTPEKPKGLPINNLVITNPSQNPAFKGDGQIAYWSGIQVDRSYCKGTTWVLMKQMDGVTFVGSDRQTNPYRGDTGCEQALPLLCMNRDFSQPPAVSSRGENYHEHWAGGQVRATVPVLGTTLNSEAVANQLCQDTFGIGYRMAEFHDSGYGTQIGEISGWKFWAYGGLDNNQRYWININDQAANPWNSVQPYNAPEINLWYDQVSFHGGDEAYVAGDKMMPEVGRAAGRAYCKGLTFVIQKQMNGMVLVGTDALSNPYTGDTNCNQRLPVLCIRVDGFSPPANFDGNNYSESWSGGQIAQSYPFSGHEINTRESANAKCVESFGEGWRMLEFHDGSLGTAGTDGWKVWGYGGLQSGRRYWVSINDQPANPWNPHAGGN